MASETNSEIYSRLGHTWWDDQEGAFASIRYFINPVRFGYFSRLLACRLPAGPAAYKLLDIGCGGGLLAEEFARAGFQVTGIDPSIESIETARKHAADSHLNISYHVGIGEYLPFTSDRFDIVVCCDVLEHVDNVGEVIAESSRVLKPGGLFLYDTINRTLASKIGVIKIMQEWPSTAFVEPNCHVWRQFIKPEELTDLLRSRSLENQEIRGLAPRPNPLAIWFHLHRRAQGKITYRELGQRLDFHESDDLKTSYMGYAVKTTA